MVLDRGSLITAAGGCQKQGTCQSDTGYRQQSGMRHRSLSYSWSAKRNAARRVRGAPGLMKPEERISGYLALKMFCSSRSSTAPSGGRCSDAPASATAYEWVVAPGAPMGD